MKYEKKITIFTGSFPFGNGETFLSQELEILNTHFNQIRIIPTYYGQSKICRNIPESIIVSDPLIPDSFILQLLSGIFNLAPVFPFIKELKKSQAYTTKQKFSRWLKISLGTRILLSSKIHKLIAGSDILYFYWGTGATYCIPFLHTNSKIFVRFHGSDLYEENNPLFFRKQIFSKLSKAIFISKSGLSYFQNKYPEFKNLGIVFNLGTKDFGTGINSNDGIFRIISCSSVNEVKRVHLICNALQHIPNKSIIWTHIGDGPFLKQLIIQASKLPSNIKFVSTGYWNNTQIMSFYKTNPADLFVNVSSSEGLPVSIMETMSFGIPAIATKVGGTSEIVNTLNGILIPKDFTNSDLGNAIKTLLKSDMTEYRKNARIFWKENYMAQNNYNKFANYLNEISND